MKDLDLSFVSIFEQIKTDIFQTRNRVLSDANRELLSMYFRIGKIIDENAKYGNNFINELSRHLKIEFPNVDGFSPRNLARMRKFSLPTVIYQICHRQWQICRGRIILC